MTNQSARPLLPIEDMASRHPGLTPPIAESFHEAARVCLDRYHESPVPFQITSAIGSQSAGALETVVKWESADDRMRGAWANETDATEAGASGCGLAALELRNGLVAVRRAETRTGADYYVAQSESQLDDLERTSRFEVSGVGGGGEPVVRQRLRDKVLQASRGNSNLPAIAGVVGFRAQIVLLEKVDES